MNTPTQAEMFRALHAAGWELKQVTWFRKPTPKELAEDTGPGKLSGFYFYSNEDAWKQLQQDNGGSAEESRPSWYL